MLITPDTDRAPIVVPQEKIQELGNGPLRAHFAAGHVSFDDSLQTAVALSGGVNDQGELDMATLSALEDVAAYTEGKDGQPIVLADVLRDSEGVKSIRGFVGVLAVGGSMMVVGEGQKPRSAIQSTGFTHAFSIYNGARGLQGLALEQSRLAGEGTIPIRGRDHELRLGHLAEQAGSRAVQEVLVGGEITEWVKRVVGENQAGYKIFKTFYSLLTENGNRATVATDALLQEPYVSMAEQEVVALRAIESVLNTYRLKRENALKVLEGVDGAATLALQEIVEEYPELEIPRLHNGDRVLVTHPMGDNTGRGPTTDRLKILLQKTIAPNAIIVRARQTGQIT